MRYVKDLEEESFEGQRSPVQGDRAYLEFQLLDTWPVEDVLSRNEECFTGKLKPGGPHATH